jgi:hypothetical protein
MMKAPQKQPKIEIDPEKAAEFGEFIKRIAKAGPQHRTRPAKLDDGKPNRARTRGRGIQGVD